MRIFFLLFFFCGLAFAVDYDCVVVGSSPFSLFEALYRANLGDKVLILEQDAVCGGAWKGIDICGVPNADLGCHLLGNDQNLKSFLEEYAGCKLVCMERPRFPYDGRASCSNGYYFSKGCYELIDHLLQMLEQTDALVLVNHRVDEVAVDPSNAFATVKVNETSFTTKKVVTTQAGSFRVEPLPAGQYRPPTKTKYYHLYLLVQDPTPPRFSYQSGGVITGINRLMNLTYFLDLDQLGQQLLVIQAGSEDALRKGEALINALKDKNLVDRGAYILRQEPFIYEQAANINSVIRLMETKSQTLFDVIPTGNFQRMTSYISKWKEALKPYHQVFP